MRTVLIIDDDASVRRVLADFLTLRGYRALVAGDGASGLALFDREAVDLVFCDLTMPGLGGLAVLEAVVQRDPHRPFVVVSGTSDVTQAVEALRRGAWDYLLKPLVDLELLVPLIVRLEERALWLREREESRAHLEAEVRQRTAELERRLDEKNALLAEVHHRVKNNLQILQVLLGLERDRSAHPEVRRAFEGSLQRLQTLALVQEEITGRDRAPRVAAPAFIDALVHHLLMVENLTAEVDLALRVTVETLGPDRAFTLGLIVDEVFDWLGQGPPPRGPWHLGVSLEPGEAGTLDLVVDEDRGVWARCFGSGTSVEADLVAALASRQPGALVWTPAEPHRLRVRLDAGP